MWNDSFIKTSLFGKYGHFTYKSAGLNSVPADHNNKMAYQKKYENSHSKKSGPGNHKYEIKGFGRTSEKIKYG